MSHELEVITKPRVLRAELEAIRQGAETEVLLTELGGDMLKLAGVAFRDVEGDEIYAQRFEREPEGRGAHFDIYNERLSEEYPWIALYNLEGTNTITTAKLPEDLANDYFDVYPEPTDEAKVARRTFSKLALKRPEVATSTGQLGPNMGLILPQHINGPHIIHNVVPNNVENPGSFVKMVVPANQEEASLLEESDYLPLEDFLQKDHILHAFGREDYKPVIPAGTPKVNFGRRVVNAIRKQPRNTQETYRSPCNLD